MLYRDFVDLLKGLRESRSEEKKKCMLKEAISKVKGEGLEPFISLLTGQFFLPWQKERLKIGVYNLAEVLREMTGLKIEGLSINDTLKIIEMGTERRGRQISIAMDQPLTVTEVYNTLKDICRVKGDGSLLKRREMVKSLLLRADSKQFKGILETVLRGSSRGFKEHTLIKALSETFNVSQDDFKRLLTYEPDYCEAINLLLKGGDVFEKLRAKPLKPLRTSKTIRATSLNKALNITRSPVALLFNGVIEVQVHRANPENQKVYTKNLVDITNRAKGLLEMFSECKQRNFILETEIYLSRFSGFMEALTSINKGEDISTGGKLKVTVTDILYLNGEDLAPRKTVERLKVLREITLSDEINKPVVIGKPSGKAIIKTLKEKGFNKVVIKDSDEPYYLSRKIFVPREVLV